MACRISLCLSWRVHTVVLLLILSSWLAPRSLRAQTFDATNLRSPIDPQVPWLLHAGDSPDYARPDFDDSQWTRFDPTTSLKAVFPNRHPEIVWYRLHVKVAPDETGLALSEWNISSAFEIYVNGQKIVQTGQVAPFVPYTFDGRLLKRIPDAEIATGSLVFAMRVHISPLDWTGAFPGYYYTNFTLGQQEALSDHLWMHVIGENAFAWFYMLVGLGLGVVALALFVAQPRQREYLWIFLLFFSGALGMPSTFYRLFHNVPAAWEYVRQSLQIANLIFMILMYFAFLRIRFGRWIQILLAVATAGMLISMVGTAHGVGSWLSAVVELTPLLAIVAGVIPVLLVIHLRRGNREAGILLVPSILSSLSFYLYFGLFLLQRVPALTAPTVRFELWLQALKLGPLVLNTSDLGACLFVLSLAVILVLRSTRLSHQQALMEGELAAAREVQQVILPEQIEIVPGFQIESIYQPAQQVGGDFFQILPAPEGALLLVIGDVTGKGLPAAMLVSVLVGAIRGVAEYTSDPAELLANLNQRLIGRTSGGFSTALVARIAANGQVVLANAGHLSPYLDGREVELPGALPLGVKPEVRYETIRFSLPAGSRLTFYSDGIVEAQNTLGELFGFERGRALSTQPVTAIVEAAKHFGQQDDMTVIAITRDAAVATAA
ncbi:MAG: SpoIIE family protein phosphatase [Terracidiphilus sp.]